MEDITNVSSEENLLQLRNDDKINEDEYEELLAAMRKPTPEKIETPISKPEKSKRILGLISFISMLSGLIIIALFYLVFLDFLSQSWLLPGIILVITAFVMGVIAWSDIFGKATAIAILVIVAFLSLPTLLLGSDKSALTILDNILERWWQR